MFKHILMLGLCLLLGKTAFCIPDSLQQTHTEYPKRMVVNGLSGVFILDWQEKYINDNYIVGLEGCEALKSQYKLIIDSTADAIHKQWKVNEDLREENRLLKDKNRDLVNADVVSQKEIKNLQKKGKIGKLERNILIVVTAFLIIKVVAP